MAETSPEKVCSYCRETRDEDNDGMYCYAKQGSHRWEDPPAPVETVKLWRCTTCGKWSFAKDKPRQHRRLIYDTYDESPPSYRVCGPFEGWTATKDEP